MRPMPSEPTSNKAVMRKRLTIIMWAEVVLMGVLTVDFVLGPLFSVHGFGLLIVGTAAAVEVGMAIAIFSVRGSDDRGGHLTVGEGWAIGVTSVAGIFLLIAWLVEVPNPTWPLVVATAALTLALLALAVTMRRRRA